MTGPFDDLIRTVLGTGIEAYHEVKPADFGEAAGRRTMFLQCVEVIMQRYPELRITLSGDRAALIDMGLSPDGDVLIGQQVYRTPVGPTFEPGRVRLTFAPRAD